MADEREYRKEIIEDIAPALLPYISRAGPEGAIGAEALNIALKKHAAKENKTREEIEDLKRQLHEAHEQIEEEERDAEREIDEEGEKAEEDIEEEERDAERREEAQRRQADSEAGNLRQQLRNASNTGSSAGKRKNAGAFIIGLLVFTLHLLATFPTLPGGAQSAFFYLIIFLLVTVTVLIFLEYKDSAIWLLGLAELLGPFLLSWMSGWDFIPENAVLLLVFLWAISSPLFLYIAWREEWAIFNWWALIVTVILIGFAVLFIADAGMATFFPSANVSFLDLFGDAMGFMADSFWRMVELTEEGIEQGAAFGTATIDYATGGYYTGIVERTEEEPVGLYIENVRTSQEVYFENDTGHLWADIGGKSFKDTIVVSTGCYVDGGEVRQGTTTPNNFSVFVQEFQAVECEIPNLAEDDRRVIFEARFRFDTWGYVTYTFVDRQTMRNYFAQDKDINRELDIDRRLRPIYTQGPVALHMSSDIPQPVPIADDDKFVGVFGVRLSDLWTDGEISRVREFEILVPNEFELDLEHCGGAEGEMLQEPSECPNDPDACAPEMDAYSFKNIDRPTPFTQLTCRLRLKDGVDIGEVIPGGQQKAQKTFIVMADYDYILEERESLDVEEIRER